MLRHLERRLLPSTAERTRLGLIVLSIGCLFPLAADWIQNGPHGGAIRAIEMLRVLGFAALALACGPQNRERTGRLIALGGVIILAATASGIAVLREDLGPYLIVTVALALGSAVGMPWGTAFQAAACAVFLAGVAAALALLPAKHWNGATVSALLAYGMAMASSVVMARLDTQRRDAAAEAFRQTVQAEQALRLANESLEQRVSERTVALADANRDLESSNARLAATNRDLEAAWRELEGYTHSVSHDLRVPLRVIHGLSGLALEEFGEILGEQGRGYLGRIGDAAIRLGQVGDDLLLLARVTRAPMTNAPVDLSAEAREVFAGIRRADPARSVDFHVDDGLSTSGDRALLRVVLEQLLDNAWKFTRVRAVATIRVGAVPGEGQGSFLVRDDGAGFDMDFAGKLFGRFEKIHDDAAIEGRGIGLAIAQRIVERHGGCIRAEGKPGAGATFTVTLP